MPQTLSILGLLLVATTAQALSLGLTASGFGACAATTITNSGLTVVNGPIGLSPGSSVTGFPPGQASAIEINSPAASNCKSDAHTAYGNGVGLSSTQVLSGVPLGGLILGPGVYSFTTSAALDGILTLDGNGSSTSQFVFQTGTTFETAVAAAILLQNGARACNAFFLVGSSATIGSATHFNGTVIAYQSIAVGTAVVAVGGFFADNGAVTLLTNDLTPPGTCLPLETPGGGSVLSIGVGLGIGAGLA